MDIMARLHDVLQGTVKPSTLRRVDRLFGYSPS